MPTRRPLRVLVAPQEFKGSLTARQAARAISDAVLRAAPNAEIDELPLSDGGPGLVDALVAAERGELRGLIATDPLGRDVKVAYGLIHGGRTAVVELGAASGLSLLRASELDPLQATSFGTGLVIKAALDQGIDQLIVGLGGSATNDGGAGIAEALGVRLLYENGVPLPRGGAALASLARIDALGLDSRLGSVRVIAASDVRNPLCGADGASAVYGPQKGASSAMVAQLDAALKHYAEIIRRDLGLEVRDVPGSGAAGGAGAGLLAFLGAEIKSGFDVLAQATHLEDRVQRTDVALTGEGSLDRQTAFGKAVAGLAGLTAGHRIPLLALAGVLGEGYESIMAGGVTSAFSIVPGPISLETAEEHAAAFLGARAEAALRTFLAGAAYARRARVSPTPTA